MSSPELVTVVVDGLEVQVPKGLGLVEAAAAVSTSPSPFGTWTSIPSTVIVTSSVPLTSRSRHRV